MENIIAPESIDTAIENGDVEAVRTWLDAGGDVNAKCHSRFSSFSFGRAAVEPLLIVAARRGRASIIDLLLSRGADIDATDADGGTALYELLNYWSTYGSLPALRLLLSSGADVNLAKESGILQTPLMIAVSSGPDVVRMLLRAGADPEHRARDLARGNMTAEEQARSDRGHAYSRCISASADLLRDIRLAGGWKRYVLQPHYDLLVLRAICHRGRATSSARTPEVLVRLFGAPDGRRRTRSSRALVSVYLPDPLFWRVLEFALGPVYDYPWVRQRVRARAAALAAAR